MSEENNLIDQMNGGKGHYEEMITGSCGVGVISDTSFPRRHFALWKIGRGKKIM